MKLGHKYIYMYNERNIKPKKTGEIKWLKQVQNDNFPQWEYLDYCLKRQTLHVKYQTVKQNAL